MSEEKIIESPDSAELFLGEAEEKTEEVPETAEEVKAEEVAAEEAEAEEKLPEEKLSAKEKWAAYRTERKLKAKKQSMENSISGKNYMSFIRRSHHPVFITEDKKDEYRSMHRLSRVKLILGAVVILLAVTAAAVFLFDNLKPETEEIPVSTGTAQAPVVLPRDDFEPVSYDPDTGLAVYDDDFNLFIVNKDNPLPEKYIIKTDTYKGIEVDEKIVAALSLMVHDIEEAGMSVSFERGYISYKDQVELYNNEVERLQKSGSTHLMAQHKAGENVDVPGYSDYHTGLSVKLTVKGDFENGKLYKWLSSHAADYGFIFRYPDGKSSVTGGEDLSVLRYVGRTNAVRMRQLSMCLEEYKDYLGSR